MTKQRKRRSSGSRLPTPVWMALLAGITLVAAGLIYLTRQQASNSSNLPYPDVPRISAAEAYDQQQAGRGIIIDVRDAPFYQESHAAGAQSLPEEALLAQINELPTDKTLIFY